MYPMPITLIGMVENGTQFSDLVLCKMPNYFPNCRGLMTSCFLFVFKALKNGNYVE